jgi:alkanesulfonate monooxygenase SsuD/methylene tetrahydromethanopterin reductase-like flavin-dependent oxidoreductase (luciferase family)
VQQPHPPLIVACFSEPTMRMAAQGEFNIVFAPFAASVVFGSVQAAAAKFRGYAEAAGFPHLSAKCSYFVALADTPAEQLRAKERLKFYQRGVRGASPTDASTAPASYAYFGEIARRNATSTAETLGEDMIITGSPAQVVEQLKRVEAAGIDEVICYFNYGALSHADTLAHMERFAAEVLPAFTTASLVMPSVGGRRSWSTATRHAAERFAPAQAVEYAQNRLSSSKR